MTSQHIPEIEDFYLENDNNLKMVQAIDETKFKKNWSDEEKGQWALEQIETAATTLMLTRFIVKGGVAIPHLEDIQFYMQRALDMKSAKLEQLNSALPIKKNRYDLLTARISALESEKRKLQREVDATEATLENAAVVTDQPSKIKKGAKARDSEDEVTSASFKLAEVDNNLILILSEWETAESSYRVIQEKLDEITSEANDKAIKAREKDSFALQRLHRSLSMLKTIISKLITKFPPLDEVVRARRNGEDSDPYETMDIKRVYANILWKYRKDDELGVLVQIVSFMRETQEGKSLPQYLRNIEEQCLRLNKLGVKSIHVSDFSAMVMLAGMSNEHRKDFFQKESIIRRASDFEDDIGSDSDDSSRGNKSSWAKKPLMAKVKAFVRDSEDLVDLTKSLDLKKPKPKDSQDEKTKAAECRDVFTVQNEAKVEEKKKCFNMMNYGKCHRGDKCKFDHDVKEKITEKSSSKPSVKSSKKEESKVFVTEKQKGANDDIFDFVVSIIDSVNINASKLESEIDCTLAWDSGSGANVAGDPRIAQLNKRMNTSGKVARGVGGVKRILSVADSELMGENDFIILDGPPKENPNLLSVSKAAKTDKSIFVFTEKGAVRMRLPKEDLQLLTEITQRAVQSNNLVGRANLRNGLYVQDFSRSEDVNWTNSQCDAEDSDSIHVAAVSTYNGRFIVDNMDHLVGTLLSSGLTSATLKHAIAYQTMKGLPVGLTEEAIDRYMDTIGPDQSHLEAAITKARKVQPIDHVKDSTEIPGEILQIDNVDPSFSRMIIPAEEELTSPAQKPKKKVVKSLGGYVDAVIATDRATGYSEIGGRLTKKNPHVILENFAKNWITRWRKLALIQTDAEFITESSDVIIKKINYEQNLLIKLRQVTPGEHDRGLGMSEGINRWRQETAQASMNRGKIHVKNHDITEEDWRRFWFHALRFAIIAGNAKPSKCNPFKSRFHEGIGETFNLAEMPMLPFMTKLVGKKLLNMDGRGETGLYLGPSLLVRGGILFYSLETKSISVKYSFFARERIPLLSDIDIERSLELLYGGLIDVSDVISKKVEDLTHTDEDLDYDAADILEETLDELSNTGELPNQPESVVVDGNISVDQDKKSPDVEILDSNKLTDASVTRSSARQKLPAKQASTFRGEFSTGRPQRKFLVSKEENPYAKTFNTTRKDRAATAILSVDITKEQKPDLPTRTLIRSQTDGNWFLSRKREYKKLVDEGTFRKLERDQNGKLIIPENSIVMPVLEVYEYKFKDDPETNTKRWLECTRAVCDGSKDHRDVSFYAETPSKSVFLLIASIEASRGIKSKAADAVRAYLNAKSLDNNLVVSLPADVVNMGLGLEKMMALDKGLYGSRSGALSFEVWFEEKAILERKFKKCFIARSVYTKQVGDDIVRLFRHSDDCRMSCANEEVLNDECAQLSTHIRMSDWTQPEKFIGCSIEYGDNYILLRQSDKIMEAEAKFYDLILMCNPKRRKRLTQLPSNALNEDNELNPELILPLDNKLTTEFRSLVGAENWISSIRMDCKFAQHVVAGRMANPRRWDLYCAIWYLEYLIYSADYPLVLGGPHIDPQAMSDASFATMKEKRSVKAHLVRTGPLSGAILASTDTIKIATTSVWDCEVQAASDAVDSLSYVMNLCEDLGFETDNTRRVQIDSQSGLDWYNSNKINSKSRHLQIKYYHTKHSVQEGVANLEFVNGEDNDIDLNTKIHGIKKTRDLTRSILGHHLVIGLGIRGIIEFDTL